MEGGQPLTLTGDVAKRLTRVLRLGVGDTFVAVDGEGGEYLLEIVSVSGKSVVVEQRRGGASLPALAVSREPSLRLTVAQAIPKGQKMDLVVQKCVELGVVRLVPMMTERTVVHLDVGAVSKHARWQKIAEEAAAQCGRTRAPEVAAPQTLTDALGLCAEVDACLLLDESEQTTRLRDALHELPLVKNVALLVGPEGGFSPSEVQAARRYGAQSVSLGPRILRTETAAMVTAALILYHYGDLG
jgi:16S rRNA (uracil1498-N3)-methyltransferase